MSFIQKELEKKNSLYISFENTLKYIQRADGGEAHLLDIARFLLIDYNERLNDGFGHVTVLRDEEEGSFTDDGMIDEDAFRLDITQTEYRKSDIARPFYLYLQSIAEFDFEGEEFFKTDFFLFKSQVIEYAHRILHKDYVDLPNVDKVLADIQQEKEKIQEMENAALLAEPGISASENDETEQRAFHERPLALKLANSAFSKFWGNANPLERDTHPDNADIAAWVVSHSNDKITQTMASRIAQVIRPEWASTGRKPQK